MFERKVVIKKQGGGFKYKNTKPSIFFFSYLKRYSSTYTFLHLNMETDENMSVYTESTPSSDVFCVVREIHKGGTVDISGHEDFYSS
jgi:hypothetical protein